MTDTHPMVCELCGQITYFEFGMLQCYEMAGRRSPPCKVSHCNGRMLHISELWDELQQQKAQVNAKRVTQAERDATAAAATKAVGLAGFIIGLAWGLSL